VRDPSIDRLFVRRRLQRGELVGLVYRLGRQHVNGLLTLAPEQRARSEVFVLRRGHAMVGEGELARKTLLARFARLASHDELQAVFEGGVTAYPPGATHQIALAGWARAHVEAQLDSSLAETLVRQLAGVRMTVRPDLAPEPADEADRRMLHAMLQPRRLDQIWPLARTPRFRLLAFIHFLRTVDALELEGVAADRSIPVRAIDHYRHAALRVLGVEDTAEIEDIKRAYRRLARALHPDLHPDVDIDRRRTLERRFAEVTAAYEALL
jgi:DnaJ-domain-containing protein 1